MKGDGLHQPVALVEDADDRDALGHRGHPGFTPGQHLPAACRLLLLLLVRGLRTAGRERQRKHESGVAKHVYSGVQGW
jgi:hypothetical protein